PLVIAGESLGALILLAHARAGATVPAGLVLASPAIQTPGKISASGVLLLAWRLLTRSSKPFRFSGPAALLTADAEAALDLDRDPSRRRELPAWFLYSVRRLQRAAHRNAESIRSPVLILWGREDRLSAFAACRSLLSIIPPELRRLEVLPGERHMLTCG